MTDPSSIDWFSVLSFLHARSPPVKAAIIGAIATCISAGVATVVVFLQIGRQARNALQQKRHDEALKLKLEVYQRILAIYAAATDAETNLSAYIRLFHAALSMARSQQDKNLG